MPNMIDHQLMNTQPSIIDQSNADCEAFLCRFRLAYLHGVGKEIGINDLRYLAMREIAELVDLVRALPDPPPSYGLPRAHDRR